jgi:hypothetical protein
MPVLSNSRYNSQSIIMVTSAPDGKSTKAVFGPIAPMPKTFTFYMVQEGDRYDKLANQFYGRPDLWWLLANANPEIFYPDGLLSGTLIRVP